MKVRSLRQEIKTENNHHAKLGMQSWDETNNGLPYGGRHHSGVGSKAGWCLDREINCFGNWSFAEQI